MVLGGKELIYSLNIRSRLILEAKFGDDPSVILVSLFTFKPLSDRRQPLKGVP